MIATTRYLTERYTSRSDLRTVVWEISGGHCEHPVWHYSGLVECNTTATEMAHIFPRGMGHTGYRDTLGNVIAACPLHAQSTDDMTHEAWEIFLQKGWEGLTLRTCLQVWVQDRRWSRGLDVS